MNVPPYDHRKAVNDEGDYSDEAQHYNDVLNQQMQMNLSNDGFVIPSRSASDISYISDPANGNARGNGTMWYDSTNNQFVALINGKLKTFMMI